LFRGNSVLEAKLLPLLWSNIAQSDDGGYEQLEHLMTRHGVMVPLTHAAHAHPTARSFLIPALLNKKRPPTLPEAKVTFFFVFAKKETIEYRQREGKISADMCRTETLFPDGLFGQILGRAVAWMLTIPQAASLDDMELCAQQGCFWDGKHEFWLSRVPGHGLVRVSVTQGSVRYVAETTAALLAEVTRTFSPLLTAALVIPADGGGAGSYERVPDWLVFHSALDRKSLRLKRETLDAAEIKARFEQCVHLRCCSSACLRRPA
jgi:hypothetical protein